MDKRQTYTHTVAMIQNLVVPYLGKKQIQKVQTYDLGSVPVSWPASFHRKKLWIYSEKQHFIFFSFYDTIKIVQGIELVGQRVQTAKSLYS